MMAAVWIILALLAWLVLGSVIALILGAMIDNRDRHG